MHSVFICYGGRQGEEIGNKLRNFLRVEGFDAFLASPRSPDITAGVDFKTLIKQKLIETEVVIVICDEGILSSQPAREEIELAYQLKKSIIPFIEGNLNRNRLPSPLQNIWSPVTFKSNSSEVELYMQFQLLELQIFKLLLFRCELQAQILENQPREIMTPSIQSYVV